MKSPRNSACDDSSIAQLLGMYAFSGLSRVMALRDITIFELREKLAGQ